MPLYQDIANELRDSIRNQTFKAGDKLPSLRKLAKQLEVSIATVLEAYHQLEAQGLVATKPQSGYYVVHRQRLLAVPPSSKNLQPAMLHLGEAINDIRANAQQTDNFDFGLAIPHSDLLPNQLLSQLAKQALKQTSTAMGGALLSPGYEPLRQQIAQLMLSRGCTIHPDQILITNGCQEALLLALQTTTKAGDIVAVESPCYHGFLLALESLNLQVVTIASHSEQGMDLDALETAAKNWPIKACIISPTISNPCGTTMGAEAKKRLVELGEKYKITLIEDDIFGELHFNANRPKPLMAFSSNNNRRQTNNTVIYCSSFSKTVAPGLRVGWILSHSLQHQFIERQMATTTGANSFAQHILSKYLQAGHHQKQLQQLRLLYQQNQQKAMALIASHFPPNTKATQPDGGFILWLSLDKKINTYKLYQLALAEKISIIPGQLFARSGFTNCLRINYARPWTPTASKKLARLGELAHKLLAQANP